MIVVAWGIAAVGVVGAPEATGVLFPGDQRELASPGGKFVVVNVDLDEPDAAGLFHRLILEDKASRRELSVYPYGRWVEALWAPDDAWLAITDGEGSDSTKCRLVDPRRPKVVLELFDALRAVRPRELGQDHTAVVCTGWSGPDAVRVRAYGYGPGRFCLHGIYDVRSRAFRSVADCPPDQIR